MMRELVVDTGRGGVERLGGDDNSFGAKGCRREGIGLLGRLAYAELGFL